MAVMLGTKKQQPSARNQSHNALAEKPATLTVAGHWRLLTLSLFDLIYKR